MSDPFRFAVEDLIEATEIMRTALGDVARDHAARFACAVGMAYANGCAVCGAPPAHLQTVGGAEMWTSWPDGACRVEISETFRLVCDEHADGLNSTRGNVESTQANSSSIPDNVSEV